MRAARRLTAGYGLFLSGPSKTTDIEQALVVGAQGPRTCTVLVIEAPEGQPRVARPPWAGH